MVESFYQTLKRYRDGKRKEIQKVAPEPQQLLGVFWPNLLGDWPKEYLFKEAVKAATRIAMSTIANAVEELGWDKFISAQERLQGPSVTKHATALKKEVGITGNTVFDVRLLTTTHSRGCGFPRHGWKEFSDAHVEQFGDWCPQIQALEDMGLADTVDELGVWCDVFDQLMVHAVNPRVQYVHAYCIGRGDKYCRCFIDYCKDEDEILNYDRKEGEKGESLYQKVRRHKDEVRKEMEKLAPEPPPVPGYGMPRWYEALSPEQVAAKGGRTKFRIATDMILVAGETLGWEKFINLIAEKQGAGFKRAALARQRDFNILGNTLRDAATLALIGYAGLPFDSHRLTRYTDERIEGIADWCPIVEAANEMGLEDKIAELSFWCDFYHNFDVHAANPNFQQVHTHCLGRGDKYCRFVIEKID